MLVWPRATRPRKASRGRSCRELQDCEDWRYWIKQRIAGAEARDVGAICGTTESRAVPGFTGAKKYRASLRSPLVLQVRFNPLFDSESAFVPGVEAHSKCLVWFSPADIRADPDPRQRQQRERHFQ